MAQGHTPDRIERTAIVPYCLQEGIATYEQALALQPDPSVSASSHACLLCCLQEGPAP